MTLEKLSKRCASFRSISLALIFMLKMFSSLIFSLPKFLAIHFGKGTLQRLRKLEQVQRKIIKHRASLKFLKARVVYNLTPKFISFKLYQPDLQFAKRVVNSVSSYWLKNLNAKKRI